MSETEGKPCAPRPLSLQGHIHGIGRVHGMIPWPLDGEPLDREPLAACCCHLWRVMLLPPPSPPPPRASLLRLPPLHGVAQDQATPGRAEPSFRTACRAPLAAPSLMPCCKEQAWLMPCFQEQGLIPCGQPCALLPHTPSVCFQERMLPPSLLRQAGVCFRQASKSLPSRLG